MIASLDVLTVSRGSLACDCHLQRASITIGMPRNWDCPVLGSTGSVSELAYPFYLKELRCTECMDFKYLAPSRHFITCLSSDFPTCKAMRCQVMQVVVWELIVGHWRLTFSSVQQCSLLQKTAVACSVDGRLWIIQNVWLGIDWWIIYNLKSLILT